MKPVRNFTMALIVFLLLTLYSGVYAVERSVKITDLKASDGSKVEVVESLKVGDLLLTDRNYVVYEVNPSSQSHRFQITISPFPGYAQRIIPKR